MKADPTAETSHDALHAAYDKWRSQNADAGKPAEDAIVTAPPTAQNASEQVDTAPPPNPESDPPTNPDKLLAPTVREMLAVPRDTGK